MAIPTYSLYGDASDAMALEWIHCETIQSRSRLHDYRIEPHRHERLFQILILVAGTAQIEIDGTRRTLSGPAVVAMPPMSVHGYAFSRDVEGRVFTFFSGRLEDLLGTGVLAERLRRPRIADLRNEPRGFRILADGEEAAEEFEQWQPDRLPALEARLRLLLIAVARLPDAWHGDDPVEEEATPIAARHVARFRDLVDQHYADHWPIETYAREIGITSIHLNRLCRELAGDSALGLVHARLLLEAKRMLTFTAMSAKEIAYSLSFSDPSYFGRFFRKMTGMSPARFRALYRDGGRRPANDEVGEPDARDEGDGYKIGARTSEPAE